jgi:hypothetical protein
MTYTAAEWTTIAVCGHGVHNAVRMHIKTCHMYANEVLMHATALDNLIVDKTHSITRYQRFGLVNPNGLRMASLVKLEW